MHTYGELAQPEVNVPHGERQLALVLTAAMPKASSPEPRSIMYKHWTQIVPLINSPYVNSLYCPRLYY